MAEKKARDPNKPKGHSRRKKDDDGFTELEREFLIQYLRTRRKGLAVARAGYNMKAEYRTAYGAMLLKKPYIAKAIKEFDDDRMERLKAGSDRILDELARMGTASLGAFLKFDNRGDPHFDLSEADDADLAAVQELKIETYMDGRGDDAREVKRVMVKMHPKTPALELLGKNLKMWTDKVEHSGEIAMPVLPIDDGA